MLPWYGLYSTLNLRDLYAIESIMIPLPLVEAVGVLRTAVYAFLNDVVRESDSSGYTCCVLEHVPFSP